MGGNEYKDYLTRKGRLVILEVLAREYNGHLREELIQKALDVCLISRSIEWVRTQLRKLEEIGGVTLSDDGGKLIAGITRSGRDHVDRRTPLDGVAWPEDEV